MESDKTQKKNHSDKGFTYENKLLELFQHQGYLSRRAIPLQYGVSNNDATDIDVLGIMFTSPFKKKIIICDCKNKVRSKPHERIFWIKGLGAFVSADEIYASMPKCSEELNVFAASGGVRVLTSDIVEQYLKNYVPYGLADATFYDDFFQKINVMLKKDKAANDLWIAVRKLYLEKDAYIVINIAVDLLKNKIWKRVTLKEKDTIETQFCKYLYCELTVLIGIQILGICADVIGISEKERKIQIKEKLTYGNFNPQKVKNILRSVENLANELVKTTVPAEFLPKVRLIDFGEFPAPDYAEDIVGLIDRAYANPQWYMNLPRILDYVLFDIGLKEIKFNEDNYKQIFNESYADQELKAAKNILNFVRMHTGIQWGFLWPKLNEFSIVNKETKVEQESEL